MGTLNSLAQRRRSVPVHSRLSAPRRHKRSMWSGVERTLDVDGSGIPTCFHYPSQKDRYVYELAFSEYYGSLKKFELIRFGEGE